jgi:hypothetical protein
MVIFCLNLLFIDFKHPKDMAGKEKKYFEKAYRGVAETMGKAGIVFVVVLLLALLFLFCYLPFP